MNFWALRNQDKFGEYQLFPTSENATSRNAALTVLTEKAKAAKECIRSTEYMTAEHMQLLDIWRDTVTRDGKRIYVNSKGRSYNMSLTKTCLDCHSNKAEFCDRCHNYASVDPFCWDCHIDNPEEMK